MAESKAKNKKSAAGGKAGAPASKNSDHQDSDHRQLEIVLDQEQIFDVVAQTLKTMGEIDRKGQTARYRPIGLDKEIGNFTTDAYQLEAGLFLIAGEGAEPGPLVGLALLKDLAKRKYRAAFRAIGLLILDGALPGGEKGAIEWLEKGVIAGSAECLFELGDLYDRPNLQSYNPERALNYLNLSAEAGDYRGQYSAAIKLYKGIPAKDDARAAALMLQAAESGHGLAAYALGAFYELGFGLAQKPLEAFRWYEKAALSLERPDILERLAHFCVTHSEIPDHMAKGAHWAAKAAALGSVPAMYILGKMRAMGLGLERDARLALSWFIAAADKGSELATLNVIYIYGRGLGEIEPDPELAIEWAMRGLELGYSSAKYVLSRMYLSGVGLERDKARSEKIIEELGPEAANEARRLLQSIDREYTVERSFNPIFIKSEPEWE